jgi:hypothetical protein
MARPRAADDFPMIRARVGELRRERDQVVAEQKGNSVIGPRPHRRETGDTEDHREHASAFGCPVICAVSMQSASKAIIAKVG